MNISLFHNINLFRNVKNNSFCFFILIIIIIDIIFFREYIFSNNYLIGTADASRQFFPYFLHLSENIKEFRIPFWWQNSGLGYPFVSIIQSGALYPPNYLFSILPQPTGYNLSIIFHFFLIQLSTYIYSNYLLKNSFFSFISSLFFSFSFFILIHLDIYPLILSSGYFILALYNVHRILDSIIQDTKGYINNLKLILATATFLSLEFLAGYPQLFFYNIVSIILYILTYLLLIKPLRKKSIKTILFIFCSVILLTIPVVITQLIATNSILENTLRKHFKEIIFNDYSYPPYMLLTYIFPYIFGYTQTLEYWGPYSEESFLTYELFNYISIINLPLFIFGTFIILRYKKENLYPLIISSLISLFLSFGYYTALHYLMYFIPVYSEMRAHMRSMFQFNLFISIISTLGIMYFYRIILIKHSKSFLKNFLKLFSNVILKNILISFSILLLLFISIEGSRITTLFKSFHYNSSNILYSLIFVFLYFLSFYLIKHNKKYLLILPLIFISDNQVFFNMYNKFINHINNRIINVGSIEGDFKYVKTVSKIKENDTLIFNRMINREKKYLEHPLTPINYISKNFKIRTINVYDPFIDLEYFSLFNMNDKSFLYYPNVLLLLQNPLILSTYGIEYFIFESDINKNFFQENIKELQTINKKEYKIEKLIEINNVKTPLKLGFKTETKNNLYLLIMKVYKQPLSKLQKFKKSLRNVQEFIEININGSYSLYHTYLDMKKELVIIPFHSPKQRHENVIEIIPLSELRTIDIENMKILSLPNGILSTNSTPFEIVYQRKNPKFSPIYQVWKNNQSLGKIFSVQHIKVVSNFDEFREKLYSFSFDPSNTAIITSDQIKKIENYKKFKIYSFIPKKIENLEFGKPNINSIKFFENTDTVEFEVNGSQPSFIVVNNRYHTDWKAYLNEQEIPVLKINGIVQGLIIPPGIHRIKLKFEPPYKKIVFLPIILMFIYTTLLVYFTIYKKHQ